jgi:CSLREA domain-containing protein
MAMRSSARLIAAGLVAWLVLALAAPAVVAAPTAPAAPTFTVNSFQDDTAAAPLNNGICEVLTNTGTCTLRAAIMKANHYPGGGVTILVPAGTYTLTIPSDVFPDGEADGDLNITNTVTLVGAGAGRTIIDGNQLDRVFTIESLGVVSISGLTVRGGAAGNVGGGLQNNGTLTLNDDVFTGNRSSNGSAGGGLANSKRLVASHTIIEDNVTNGNAGGVYNDTGASLQFTDSIIRDNQTFNGGWGGGLVNDGALTLTGSLVQGNQSAGKGGGFWDASGTLTLLNTTVSNNSAVCDGGGLEVWEPMTATFSTIVGNLANSERAGVTGTCPDGGRGGGIGTDTTVVNLRASLLGENFAGDTPEDGYGEVHSLDYDLIETTAGITLTGITTHNRTGLDPLIDSPHDNGGPTPTRALLRGSPALDWVPAGQCKDGLGAPLTTDQRGLPRPVNGLCDIGAYEGQPPALGYHRNLVRNGDAEGAAGSPNPGGAYVGVPNWQNSGQLLTTVPYNNPGGFPSVPTDTVPVVHGDTFFGGGPVAGGAGAVSGGNQALDLSPLSAAIDAGDVRYDFSADLGGYRTQEDNAQIEADFLDHIGNPLMVTTIGPVSAGDRSSKTGLLHRDDSAAVPAGTRTVVLYITLTRPDSSGYDDGYADNISFVLLPKDELFLPVSLR